MRAALLAVVVLLIPGCSSPEPTSIEVYAEPSASQPDGVKESSGTCSGDAAYEAHVQALSGSVTVTTVDGAGAKRTFTYSASGADKADVPGASGAWTLRVEWSGFRGSIHAGLLC